MSSLYQLEEVSFHYGKEKLIEGLSLEVQSGDFIAVMGANGSGKTTLVRLLSGYLKPESGNLRMQGKKMADLSPRERAQKIAVVPQNFDVLFPFTAKEVVLMGRWAHIKPMAWENHEDLEITREAMELTDSWSFKDRPVTELSGGEKERVLLARALAQQAQILLLDEPTTHLDIQHQIEIFKLLKQLHLQKKLTIIAVLHDLNFAAQACEKILLLQKGKGAKFAESEKVLSPQNILEVFGTSVDIIQRENHSYYFPKMSF